MHSLLTVEELFPEASEVWKLESPDWKASQNPQA